MVATDFVTDKALRDKYIDKVEVLDRIENVELLAPLPSTEYVTMNQIADFYQVPLETIERCYQRHESEICSDGVIVLTPKKYKEFLNGTHCSFKNCDDIYTQYNGKMAIHIDSDTDVIIPNRGIKAFPRRASLRFGMLLTDSDVAEQVRTYLLDTEERVVITGVVTSDNGADLFMNCVQAKGADERLRACYEFSRYKDMQIAQRDARIIQLEEQIKNLQQSQQLITTKSNRVQRVYGSKEVKAMRRRFSKIIRIVTGELKVPYGVVYDDVYTLLEDDYNISLRERRDRDPKEQRIIRKEEQGVCVNHIPMITYLEDDEWENLYECVKKYLESYNINSDALFSEVKNADKRNMRRG